VLPAQLCGAYVRSLLASREGFEPSMSESESGVLPITPSRNVVRLSELSRLVSTSGVPSVGLVRFELTIVTLRECCLDPLSYRPKLLVSPSCHA
jgi:hypothetical protein